MDPELFNHLRLGIIYYIILLASVCIHEWAHAFTADKLGDPLPRAQGRVTLNPMAHMDMLGTVIFPLIMIFWPMFAGMGSKIALIGWGKPVMISLPNPKTRKRDDMLITAAGPLSNLVLCLICAVTMGFVARVNPAFIELLQIAIILNAALFVFNLLPIPPLDGAHFLKHLLKMREETYMRFSRWGFLLLLVLINLPPFRIMLGTAIYKIVGLFNQIAMSI